MNRQCLKFTLDSGDVYFYDEEMCAVSELPEQNLIVHPSQQSAPTVKVYDSQFKTFQIAIEDAKYETLENVQKIVDEKNEMTFYPHYQYSASTSYKVILIPNEFRKVYAYGEREAMLQISLNLLESSKV